MNWSGLSDAQLAYLLDVIEIARWEAGKYDLDLWRSLATEAERRGLTDTATEARECIAEIEAPPKPAPQPEPLASHLPHVHVAFTGSAPPRYQHGLPSTRQHLVGEAEAMRLRPA